MNTASQSPRAIIALPPLMHGFVRDTGLRRWLSRGVLSRDEQATVLFDSVLRELGHDTSNMALGALRFWGHTGERSASWIAVAELVHLEAQLDHLALYALSAKDMAVAEFRQLCEFLQSEFGSPTLAFAVLGDSVFLRRHEPMATAAISARDIAGRQPDAFMPAGPAAAAHDRLLGEIQLALHEHPVNLARAARGLPVVNSVWFWGGGVAPQKMVLPIPLLFSNDKLFRGYWLSCTGVVAALPRDTIDVKNMASQARDAFVAVIPSVTDIDALLLNVKSALRSGILRRVTLITADGLRIDLVNAHRFRFWRRTSRWLRP